MTDSAEVVSEKSRQVAEVSMDIKRYREISHGATEQAGDAESSVRIISSLADKIEDVSKNADDIGELTKKQLRLQTLDLNWFLLLRIKQRIPIEYQKK